MIPHAIADIIVPIICGTVGLIVGVFIGARAALHTIMEILSRHMKDCKNRNIEMNVFLKSVTADIKNISFF